MSESDPAAGAAAIGKLRPETFLRHFQDIRDAKGEADERSTAVARAKKAAKRDGVNLDVLKMAETLKDMDEAEVDIYLNTLRSYCTWLKVSLSSWSTQFEVAEPKKASQAEFEAWQAGQAGLLAGRTGSHEREGNPFLAGTAQHVQWDKQWVRGWRNSNRKVAKEMMDAAKAKELLAANGKAKSDIPREKPSEDASAHRQPEPADA